MRNNYFYVIAFLIFFSSLVGCKKDSSVDWPSQDKASPELNLVVSTIHSDQERNIEIKGQLTDDLGIQTINLKDAEWFFDKTIQVYKDSLIKSYSLDYFFKVPKDAAEKEHQIVLTVTDMAGKTTTKTVKVYMDGDFNAPTIAINGVTDGAVLIPAPGDKFNLNFACSDDRRMGYFVIKEASLGLNDSITSLSSKTYNYTNNNLVIPLAKANYTFQIAVGDSAGNRIERTVRTSVQVDWDFPNMYLSDVATVDELNSDLFGVPMVVDKTAAYTYSAVYFSSKANTQIKFLAQKTNFTPHCFGIDPSNSNKLINSAAKALPIILPEVGYYKILFNTNPDILSYSVQKIDPMADPNRPDLYVTNTSVAPDKGYVGPLGIAGEGFVNRPGWSPAAIGTYPDMKFNQDPTYLYHWTTTVTVSGNVKFTLTPEHPWGWWPNPFWRQDSNNAEKSVFGGGSNVTFAAPSQATTYVFTFDMYLNRMKMVKQ